MPRDIDDSTRFLLEGYRKDLDKLDDKWETYIVGMIRLEESQKVVSMQVQKLTKLLTEDNGRPSVINQINALTTEVQSMNKTIDEIKDDLTAVRQTFGIQVPKEVAVERWKTVAKVAAVVGAALPGIMSFIHSFF